MNKIIQSLENLVQQIVAKSLRCDFIFLEHQRPEAESMRRKEKEKQNEHEKVYEFLNLFYHLKTR